MIKRLFQIALPIVMAWLMVMPLSAQGVAFGVKGGLEVVSMEFNDDVFDKTNRAGFFIGPTFVISTALPGLAIDISGLYNERTLKVEGESVQQKSILIPAHIRYGASIMGFGIGIVCTVIGIVWSLIIIALAWLFYRPLLGIGLLVLAGFLVWVFAFKGKDKLKELASKGKQPQSVPVENV